MAKTTKNCRPAQPSCGVHYDAVSICKEQCCMLMSQPLHCEQKHCLPHLQSMPSFVPCDYHLGRVKAVRKDRKTSRQIHSVVWKLQWLSLLLAEEQTDCAVYAMDGLGDDISSSIAYVTSNPSCSASFAGDMACPQCAVEYMQQGLCLPDRYNSSPTLRCLLLLTVHCCGCVLL